MRNKSSFLLVVIIALLMTGCGGVKTKKINDIADLKDKVIGAISLSPDTKGMEAMISGYVGSFKEAIFYNRTSDEVAAVLAGKIDACVGPNLTMDYYAKRNPNLKVIAINERVEGSVFMAVRSEDEKLKAELDSAITILHGNGILKTLEEKWITNLPAYNEPTHTDIPKIPGAKTVYVGVAGDFPPLDYMAADGRPAGYNVATLTEMGKVVNINFEFVSIETQARFAALSGKKIDVIFCNFENKDHEAFTVALRNNSWISTKPYCNYLGGYFLIKGELAIKNRY
jgi:ABC-type amino acid transport substrate-binding protein